jgi:hypothetical protein
VLAATLLCSFRKACQAKSPESETLDQGWEAVDQGKRIAACYEHKGNWPNSDETAMTNLVKFRPLFDSGTIYAPIKLRDSVGPDCPATQAQQPPCFTHMRAQKSGLLGFKADILLWLRPNS